MALSHFSNQYFDVIKYISLQCWIFTVCRETLKFLIIPIEQNHF